MKTSLISLGNKIIFIGSVAIMLSITDPWYRQGTFENSGASLYRTDKILALAIVICAAVAGVLAILREAGKGKRKKGSGMERFLIIAGSAVAAGLVVLRVIDPPGAAETVSKILVPLNGDMAGVTTESVHVEVTRMWGQWLAIAGAAIVALGNLVRFGGGALQGRGGEAGPVSGSSGVTPDSPPHPHPGLRPGP